MYMRRLLAQSALRKQTNEKSNSSLKPPQSFFALPCLKSMTSLTHETICKLRRVSFAYAQQIFASKQLFRLQIAGRLRCH